MKKGAPQPHATDQGRTRTEAVVETVRQQIARGRAAPGQRLPSIRQLAQQLKISKSTVEEAYDRLVADGVIEAEARRGFYVSRPPL